MAQNQTVGTHGTGVSTDEQGVTRVVYHGTTVVRFDDDEIVLDTGGWQTHTTKMRMNQASNQYNLGYRVYSKGGKWYVVHNWAAIEFDSDKMIIPRQ